MTDSGNVQQLKGVGPSLAATLAKLGIRTLEDLLFHLPFRYEDRTRLTPIGALQHGSEGVVEGQVVVADTVFGKRRSLLCLIQDGTGTLGLRFYHFSKAQQNNLKKGARVRCFGEARRGASGFEMYHPEYKLVRPDEPLSQSLTAVYPITAGITQTRLRALIEEALDRLTSGDPLPELLPLASGSVNMALVDALQLVHRPDPTVNLQALLDGTHPAQQRLAFEELVAHRCSLRIVHDNLASLVGPKLSPPAERYVAARESFGFTLTRAQRKTSAEIAADMTRRHPMLRLLQGDVGSGKTVVAALAAIHTRENDLQTAIMAPTEILAEQHYLNFSQWFRDTDITIAWLSGKVKGKQRAEQLGLIESGTAHLAIGTHALFQDQVRFRRLGLVIIDEQHRFGVQQRLRLLQKGVVENFHPHQLIMTATPIPRTLTMSMYADMDTSVIDELPPGRQPVTTSVVSDARRSEVVTRVSEACRAGAQAYWVCTLIDESEDLVSQAAESTARSLTDALPALTVGLIHGRMTAAEKSDVMKRFKDGAIHLLVATTVIEVGVDVANASLMIIENPERLGLAQLHQLRGRVGRGNAQSHCLLMYHAPLSETARARLNVMRETNDGFEIAEQDLLLRGPGEVLGNRQAGNLQFRVADLIRDRGMLGDVKTISDRLVEQDRPLAELLVGRWLSQPEEVGQV